MFTKIEIGQYIWCDTLTCCEYVTTVDGEEYGAICPNCHKSINLMFD